MNTGSSGRQLAVQVSWPVSTTPVAAAAAKEATAAVMTDALECGVVRAL